MRKLYSLLTIIACLALFSCEEVIPLDLKSGTPKLVVEAALTWKKGTTGNVQKIKLSTTTDYYSDTPKICKRGDSLCSK